MSEKKKRREKQLVQLKDFPNKLYNGEINKNMFAHIWDWFIITDKSCRSLHAGAEVDLDFAKLIIGYETICEVF